MKDFWQSVRRWPLYSLLVAGVLALFVGLGLSGRRLLGDDNESDPNELAGPPQGGGHGGAARFYHK